MSMGVGKNLATLIEREVERQDAVHPGGYPVTRDGLRLGIASLEDETREALDAWQEEKAKGEWVALPVELLQAIAVGIRTLRGLEASGRLA